MACISQVSGSQASLPGQEHQAKAPHMQGPACHTRACAYASGLASVVATEHWYLQHVC